MREAKNQNNNKEAFLTYVREDYGPDIAAKVDQNWSVDFASNLSPEKFYTAAMDILIRAIEEDEPSHYVGPIVATGDLNRLI